MTDLISRAALLDHLRKERDDYFRRHFVQDPATGAYEASNAKEEYLSELDERIEFFEGFAPAFAYGIIDPDYARIFTIARCIAWAEGYALAMHGSFTRDLDLIAVPWAAHACEPDHLARRIENAAALTISVAPKNDKPFGRLVWTMTLPTFADPRFVDLSVMPPAVAETNAAASGNTSLVSGASSEQTSPANEGSSLSPGGGAV